MNFLVLVPVSSKAVFIKVNSINNVLVTAVPRKILRLALSIQFMPSKM